MRLIDAREVMDAVFNAIDMAQQPKQCVEHHHGPGIADMGAVIDGRPADIHARFAGDQRLQLLHLAGLAVVEADLRHGGSRSPSSGAGIAALGRTCKGRAEGAPTARPDRSEGISDQKL